MDIQSLQTKINELVQAVNAAGKESFKYQEYADAVSGKFNELMGQATELKDVPADVYQSMMASFNNVTQRVDIESTAAGSSDMFTDFLETARNYITLASDKLQELIGPGTQTDTQPQQPTPPTPEAPTMQMMPQPPTPPMAGGPPSDVPAPPAGRNDRVGPGGSNFSRRNITPSDTQQYLRTFDPYQRALDREMKERGYQKVGPGGLRREEDGSIRRKSQYGGALGSLSNFLGDVGNTLTKNRKVKP